MPSPNLPSSTADATIGGFRCLDIQVRYDATGRYGAELELKATLDATDGQALCLQRAIHDEVPVKCADPSVGFILDCAMRLMRLVVERTPYGGTPAHLDTVTVTLVRD